MKPQTEKNERPVLSALKNVVSNITVEPYLFFCHVPYLLRLIPLQDLLMDRSCRNTFQYGDDICNALKDYETERDRVVSSGNDLYTWVMLISSLPTAIVAIFLGPWSDRYSRKYPMIIAASGLFLEALANAILTTFPKVSPTWYIVCGIFSGVSGGFLVCISSAFSYVSDITNEKTRAGRFAIIEFANLLAILVGSLLGGQIYKNYGYLEALVVCPVCYGAAILYTIIFVKETKPPVPPERRLEMFQDLLRLDNLKQSYITCTKKRPGNLRFQILLLFFIGTWHRFTDLAWLSGCFSIAGYVSVKSRLSKLVRKEEVGSIFSLLGTCESFAPLLGSTVFLQLFNATGFFPGFTFALGGLSLIPCAVGFAWMMGLPTISLSDYGREEESESKATPLETITSSSYSRLEEEKY